MREYHYLANAIGHPLHEADIGRRVGYRPIRGTPKDGVIASFDVSLVYVLYDGYAKPQATEYRCLVWLQR